MVEGDAVRDDVEARWTWDADNESGWLISPEGKEVNVAEAADLITTLQAHADLAAQDADDWEMLAMDRLGKLNTERDLAAGLQHYKRAYETPYGQCYTLPDGDCIGRGCMHDSATAGLRAAAELADELVKALRDCCTQVERFAKSSGMNARVNAYDTLYARYDALNPQPHHESRVCVCTWLEIMKGEHQADCPMSQPHHEETKAWPSGATRSDYPRPHHEGGEG